MIAAASLNCHAGLGASLLASSRDLGWTTLLLDHHRIVPHTEAFETPATPDQTIVVQLSGEQEIEVAGPATWRRALYRPGTMGMSPGDRQDRVRRKAGQAFQKLNIYLAAPVIAEAAETCRRAGQPPADRALNALAFQDAMIWHTATALMRAVAAGAPDLYAQAAGCWLATHLLHSHAGRAVDEDMPAAAPITDKRLARVLDIMAARFAEPLSLDELAAEAGISKFHFVRLFREKTGRTPFATLTALRLDAVRSLLAGTDLSIGEIAGRCGFTSGQQLAEAFRRRIGASPQTWRNAHRLR